MNWVAYTEAAQRLSDVRQREARRRSQVADHNEGLHAAVDQLNTRLAAQRDHVSNIAELVRVPIPDVPDPEPSGLSDPQEAVRLAWDAVHRADAETGQVEQRARQAALFPGMQQGARNLAIYAIAAFAFAVLSALVFDIGWLVTRGSLAFVLLPTSLCAMPVLAFATGYVTITVAGQPRVQTDRRPNYSVRLGWVICFLTVWLVWLFGLLLRI